jgi:hypothetical protein
MYVLLRGFSLREGDVEVDNGGMLEARGLN